MKLWVKKLIEQFEFGKIKKSISSDELVDITEDRATLLYIIDVYNKHLIETDKYPVRKAREILDEFTKALLQPASPNTEKVLFRLRQFFSSYRIDESAYIQSTFEDFKGIIWDFADQLSEEIHVQKKQDDDLGNSLNELREAVESNSIDDLRTKSREFIDFYVEQQTKRDTHRTKKLSLIQENLEHVKQKLVETRQKAQLDHLTGAFNRMSFDEHLELLTTQMKNQSKDYTLLLFDIDHFKKVNDTFGHDVGDTVIKDCVRITKEVMNQSSDYVARVGGEEFAVILSDTAESLAVIRAEELMQRIRNEVIVSHNVQVRFTVSMGIAQLAAHEHSQSWYKRADLALYDSKNAGRDRYSIAPPPHLGAA